MCIIPPGCGSAGVDSGVGDVGAGVGVDADTVPVLLPPLDPPSEVGAGVGGVPPFAEIMIDPSVGVTEILLNDRSYNEPTSRFSGVEPVPTAVNSTFANVISPFASYVFDAEILTKPIVLLGVYAATCESGPLVTSVTCTTDGSYSMFIVPLP